MQAAAVEVLTRKAGFDSVQAIAIADAIDVAIAGAQLVTIPVLDARLAAMEARFDAKLETGLASLRVEFRTECASIRTELANLRAELVRWVFLVMLGNVALGAGATALVNFLQHGR